MKTREQIYGDEALDLLRIITMYKSLYETQLLRLYPGKEQLIRNLLLHLTRQGRIYHNSRLHRYSANKDYDMRVDMSMIAAVWVLIDFIEKVEYHLPGDFPVKLCFFSNGESYEIVYVQEEQEVLISHALEIKTSEEGTNAKRIVMIDSPDQIGSIKIVNVSGYCKVAADGTTLYYKLE